MPLYTEADHIADGEPGTASRLSVAQPSTSSLGAVSSGLGSSAIASVSASMPPDSARKSKTFVTALSTETLFSVTFTPAPNATGIAQAQKCWDDIMTWRNQSASWYNAHVANRTWSIGPAVMSDTVSWSSSTTIYPQNVSVYTLCDGTPRANVRPITKHFSGNSTTYFTITSTLTPQYRSQPCTPDPEICRMWYYDSNIKLKDDQELVRQCGNPAHQGAPCLIGGGPVQLVYFPVTTVGGHLCGNNGTTLSEPGVTEGAEVVTTLGHTFTSGSVYLSFSTLFASYDGFWDRIGPTFSNFILPLPSAAISTQCGGWGNAHGPGTPLNYADLNWPVPASAYSCQDRCSVTWTSTCATCLLQTLPKPLECNTIWSDVDPVLAVPTKVREMVPEWSTCSFWDFAIPNFFFDPPIALHAQPAMATPTWPSRSVTTAAAPSSTAQDPLPKNTATSQDPDPSNTESPGKTKTAHNDPNSVSPSRTPANGASSDPPSPQHTDPSHESQDPGKPAGSPLRISMAALSILAQALSSDVPETDPAMKTMASAAHSIANSVLNHHNPDQSGGPDHPQPKPGHSVTGAVLTVSGTTLTALWSNGHMILGSKTLEIGQSATISGLVVSAGSSGLVIGSRTAALTALPASASYASIPFSPVRGAHGGHTNDDGTTVVSAGSLTLTESAVGSTAVVVHGTTLSFGGPKATISGYIVTEGSKGLIWLSVEASGQLPSVVTESRGGISATNSRTHAQSRTAALATSSTSTSGASSQIVVRSWCSWPTIAIMFSIGILLLR